MKSWIHRWRFTCSQRRPGRWLSLRCKYLLALSLLMTTLPVLAQPAPQNVTIAADLSTNYSGVLADNIFSYLEPSTTTCTMSGTRIIIVPPNTVHQAVNTGTLFTGFTTPLVVGLADASPSPGVALNVGLSTNSPRIHMAANGFIYNRTSSGFPIFYIDNPSLTEPAAIQVFMLGN